jgi:hypothetical protein
MKAKYIIVELSHGLSPYRVRIFPAFETHSEVLAEMGLGGLGGDYFVKSLSAGFCDQVSGNWICFGESDSTGLKSRADEDATLLNAFFPSSPNTPSDQL